MDFESDRINDIGFLWAFSFSAICIKYSMKNLLRKFSLIKFSLFWWTPKRFPHTHMIN